MTLLDSSSLASVAADGHVEARGSELAPAAYSGADDTAAAAAAALAALLAAALLAAPRLAPLTAGGSGRAGVVVLALIARLHHAVHGSRASTSRASRTSGSRTAPTATPTRRCTGSAARCAPR